MRTATMVAVAGLVLWSAFSRAEEAPVSPFGRRTRERADAVEGTLSTSDGKTYEGKLYLTRDKKLEVFDLDRKKWYKLKLKEIASLRFEIESEIEEKEWRWKEGGSDVKVYTGRSYFDRKYIVNVKLSSGESLRGHVRGAPIYVKGEGGKAVRFMLRKDQRGEWGQKPDQIVYVKEIVFGPGERKEEAVERAR